MELIGRPHVRPSLPAQTAHSVSVWQVAELCRTSRPAKSEGLRRSFCRRIGSGGAIRAKSLLFEHKTGNQALLFLKKKQQKNVCSWGMRWSRDKAPGQES
jgi:hypothetical protein